MRHLRPSSDALRPRRQRGLTLVELLLVLVILALLAGMALTTTSGLVEQSRYENTGTLLRNIEAAVLGPANQHDSEGSPLVTGFVADVGRLPVSVEYPPGSGRLTLAELWDKPSAFATYAVGHPPGDPEVRMGAGWRGPYLQLGIGARELTDAWDAAPVLMKRDGSLIAVNETVEIVSSFGADGVPAGDSYNEDRAVVLGERAIAPVSSKRHVGSITGNIYVADHGTNPPGTADVILVRVYGPVDGVLRTIDQKILPANNGAPLTYEFATVPIGPRVVRAYLFATAVAPAAEDPLTTPPPAKKSAIHRVVIQAGGLAGGRDLILKPVPTPVP